MEDKLHDKAAKEAASWPCCPSVNEQKVKEDAKVGQESCWLEIPCLKLLHYCFFMLMFVPCIKGCFYSHDV